MPIQYLEQTYYIRLSNSTCLGVVLESYDLDAHISIGKDTLLAFLQSKICLSMLSEEYAALAC